MSATDETAQLLMLTERARQTRTLLKRDIRALVFKVSPDNLKREAIDAARDAALEARASVVRLGVRAKDFVQAHGVATSLALGMAGLLYAARSSRRRPLFLACAAMCGAAAVLSARRDRREKLALPTAHRDTPLLRATAKEIDVS